MMLQFSCLVRRGQSTMKARCLSGGFWIVSNCARPAWYIRESVLIFRGYLWNDTLTGNTVLIFPWFVLSSTCRGTSQGSTARQELPIPSTAYCTPHRKQRYQSSMRDAAASCQDATSALRRRACVCTLPWQKSRPELPTYVAPFASWVSEFTRVCVYPVGAEARVYFPE